MFYLVFKVSLFFERGHVMSENLQERSDWQDFIAPLCSAIGKSEEEVTSALKSLIGEAGPEAIELLRSEELSPFAEIQALFSEVPKARLRRAVQTLRQGAAAAETGEAPAVNTVLTAPSLDILPTVPDDGAWLTMLKASGELKVDTGVVISGIRAALAGRTGLYDLPRQIAERMEAFSESLDEPAPASFYKLRKQLTQRSYAEIFAALEVEGTFVSERRKNALLERLDKSLWPALQGFQNQLRGWMETWQQGFSNPGLLVGALAAFTGGGSAIPAGMIQPPDTSGLRDSAEAVITEINRSFSGVGIPVAMALAWDAQKIKEVLERPELPSQLGAANREQMLKMLGAAVSADYVRLERNLTRYALGVMEFGKVTGGQAELAYLTSLTMLGSQIPWDKLGTPARRAGAAQAASRSLRRSEDE